MRQLRYGVVLATVMACVVITTVWLNRNSRDGFQERRASAPELAISDEQREHIFDVVMGISGLWRVVCRWVFLALRQCREPPAPRKGDEPRAGKMEKCRRICQGNAMFGLRDACPVEDPHPEKREARLEG